MESNATPSTKTRQITQILQLVQHKAELPVVVVFLVAVCFDQLLGVQTSVVFVLSCSRLTEDKDFISQVST